MIRTRKHLKFAARLTALLVALALISLETRATILIRMSLEKLSQESPAIVRARCVASSTGWDAGEIWTFTLFEVEETWRGSVSARITVRLLGGSAGNITSSVAGVPRFRPGEDVVLFLASTPRGDFSVVSWQQGTFRIGRDIRSGAETVTQDTASFATFDPAARQFEASGIRNLPLEVFRARVEAALRTATARTQ
jgi:hypothetical protein